jgi:branched-subunit amino acid ABC-type transport system permease component
MNSIVQSLFAQPILLGLIWSIFALGVFVSFRILNIADMSVEGLFPFSAVITLWAIASGWNPILALLFAIVLGFLSGVLMGVLKPLPQNRRAPRRHHSHDRLLLFDRRREQWQRLLKRGDVDAF